MIHTDTPKRIHLEYLLNLKLQRQHSINLLIPQLKYQKDSSWVISSYILMKSLINHTPFFVRYAWASKAHNCVDYFFLEEDTTCLVGGGGWRSPRRYAVRGIWRLAIETSALPSLFIFRSRIRNQIERRMENRESRKSMWQPDTAALTTKKNCPSPCENVTAPQKADFLGRNRLNDIDLSCFFSFLAGCKSPNCSCVHADWSC